MEVKDQGEDLAGVAAEEPKARAVTHDRVIMQVMPTWEVAGKIVPVTHGETRIGEAVLSVVGRDVWASIRLDGGEDPRELVGLRMGLSGSITKFHRAADGVDVVDEIVPVGIVVG